MRQTLAVVIGLFSLCSLAAGEEAPWARFRGPNGEGHSPTVLPAAFEPEQFNWKIELPGVGHASPVVWGDKIFLISADPKTATRYVLCVSRDGRILWTREYPSESHHLHERSSFASSTPAVDGEHVYVSWSTPSETTLMALDHEGRVQWRKNLGPWTSSHGFGTSPILYRDLVILFNSQQAEQLNAGQQPGKSWMMAFRRSNGEEVWRTPRESVRVCYSVPFVWKNAAGQDELICCSTAEGLFSLNPETGAPNWQAGKISMRTVGSPIEAGGLLFCSTGSGGGGNYVIAVRPGDKPEVVYDIKRVAPYVPTMVKLGPLVFLWYDKGVVSCIEAATGEVHWRERVDGGFSGSPIIAGDKVYCIDEEGTLVAVAADKKFQLLGRTKLGEPSRSTPAVSGGHMYLRTESHLISVGGPAT